MAYRNDNAPLESREASWLLAAAKYGPTAFPIFFAAILSQFMTTIASNQLEKGTSIGLLEYLLGTRSLGSAFVAVFKFKMFNMWLPVIMVAWCFSPLGGQSSLRLVSSGLDCVNTSATFNYLDTKLSKPSIEGASGAASFDPVIYNAFNGALGSPGSLKNSSQDMYANIHIPELKSLTTEPSPDGWYDVRDTKGPYVALIGIPFEGATSDSNSTFTLETSYMSLDCEVEVKPENDTRVWNGTVGCTNCTTYRADAGGSFNSLLSLRDGSVNHEDYLSTAGRIGLQSYSTEETLVTESWCYVTTMHVEAAVECSEVASNCSVTAMRESTIPHPPDMETVLDCTFNQNKSDGCQMQVKYFFFSGLLASVTPPHAGDYSALELYFLRPDSLFVFQQGSATGAPIASIGKELFSRRLAQLLNTYWLAYVAPFAVTGNLSAAASTSYDNTTSYAVANSTGTKQTSHVVLKYHHGWGICLISISVLLILTSLTTAFLEANRRGPSVLDTFISSQINNPYVQIDRKEAMEDGVDIVRRSRNKDIRLGDVQPLDEVGLLAIATPEKLQPVDVLRKRRVYHFT